MADVGSRRDRRRNEGYESNDGFSTYTWAPLLWFLLHMISCNFPCAPTPQQRREYYQFFVSLGHVLPCGECRRNYPGNLSQAGFSTAVFKSRHTLARFVYRLHEVIAQNTKPLPPGVVRDSRTGAWINRVTREPVCALGFTFAEMRETNEVFRSRCGHVPGTKEKGCVFPKEFIPSRVVIKVVPRSDQREPTFSVDPRVYTRLDE